MRQLAVILQPIVLAIGHNLLVRFRHCQHHCRQIRHSFVSLELMVKLGVLLGNDQRVMARQRIDVLNSHSESCLVYDSRRNLPADYLAKDARRAHISNSTFPFYNTRYAAVIF